MRLSHLFLFVCSLILFCPLSRASEELLRNLKFNIVKIQLKMSFHQQDVLSN